MIVVEDQPGRDCIKIGLPRRIDSRRLFSREYDFQKTFFRTENPFSGKTYFYTIASSTSYFAATFPTAIWPGMYLVEVLNASSFSQYSQARYASQVPSPTTGCPRFLWPLSVRCHSAEMALQMGELAELPIQSQRNPIFNHNGHPVQGTKVLELGFI